MDTTPGLINLYTLADGDPEFVKEILGLMQKNIPEDITAIEEAFAANDMDVVRRSAHHMKSSIQYSDDTELSGMLSGIESKKDLSVSEVQIMLPKLRQLSQALLHLIQAELKKIG